MQKKRILFINPNWEQEPLIRYLEKKDYSLHGILEKENDFVKNFSSVSYCDLRDLNEILNIAKKIKPGAVISDQCDYSMFAQAIIAENLKIKGPSINNAQISSNKLLQRKLCLKLGIKIPNFTYGYTLEQLVNNTKTMKYPLIIKPIDNRGSFGVYKINNKTQLAKYFYKSISMSHSRIVIVEEFIDGIHLTVDGYIFEGKGCKSMACASKKLIDREKQVAMEIIYPAKINLDLRKKVMKLNEEINNKIGYKFGLTHTEFMLTKKNEIYLIESANRGGGCFTSEIILPYHSKFNLFQQLENDIFGKSKNYLKKLKEDPVILKFFGIKSGKIKNIHGLEHLENCKDVLKFRLNFKENDIIQEISNDGNRHGFLIMKGKEINIVERSKNLINKIKVDFF